MRQARAGAGPAASGRKRARRLPEEARRQILDAAEGLLAAGGLHAVTVRSVAERVGMTDMGVNHHFGSREALLDALIARAAARFRQQLALFVEQWARDGAQLSALVAWLSSVYSPSHTQLVLALYQAGWRERGGPLLEPVVQALHAARERRLGARADIDETRHCVASMHQALALEPVFGAEFRRSAGLTGQRAKDPAPARRWWLRTLAQQLGVPA